MRVSMAIKVRGLVHKYGDVIAVNGIDIDVAEGQCFGLLGPNGAGKTTTVEILEGLLTPTSGEVSILGHSWKGDANAIRQRLGIALQETTLADRLTVREIVRLFRSFHDRGADPDAVIATAGLTDKNDAWVMKLSGGQKQRLAIACALVGDPDLLFLDEPTTGLDPQARRDLWEVVGDVVRRGRTCLLTTHYMEEAERLCHRVATMDKGRIIAEGTPAELIGRLGGSQVLEFGSAPGMGADALNGLPGVREARHVLDRWRLTVDAAHEAVPALLERLKEHGNELTALSTHQASLDDVFVSLTGRTLRGEP
jgi:ABC-2 type transport system ATP-binding protein